MTPAAERNQYPRSPCKTPPPLSEAWAFDLSAAAACESNFSFFVYMLGTRLFCTVARRIKKIDSVYAGCLERACEAGVLESMW